MPAAALSYSTTTTRLPTPSSASSQKTPTSALKRKWELSGEVNSISSTKPSKKSMKRKVRIADPSATTEMSAQYYSTSSSPSDASQSLAQQQQPSPSNTGSTSNNTSDPSLTAFHRSMFQSYVKNALDDLEKQNTDTISALASRISLNKSSPEAFTDEQLFYILNALTSEISRLDTPSSNELVSAILNLKWTKMGASFVGAYVRFLTVLVSGVPRWWSDVITHMVQGFQDADDTTSHHLVIRHILRLMPTIVSSFQAILSNNFPHKSESKIATLRYLQNLLKVIEYCPELRGSAWSLIFERAIQLDVELQDSLLDSDDEEDDDSDEDEDEEMGTPSSPSDETADPYVKGADGDDDEEAILDVSKIVRENQHTATEAANAEDKVDRPISNNELEEDDDDDEDGAQIHGAASLFEEQGEYEYDVEGGVDVVVIRNKLDAMMTLLFGYLDQKITSESVLEEHGEAQVLFTTLLAHFKSFILSTHRTRSVQFLLFRAAHVHPALLDAFLVSLIEIALSPSENMDKRLKAMQYISSFIARARGLSRTQILFVVSILSDWLQRYVDERESEVGTSTGGMGKFKMFYAVSQALMYIFCFRHATFRVDQKSRASNSSNSNGSSSNGSKKDTSDSEWECNLDKVFQRIVISKFNPLRYCRDTVVSKFAQLALRENLVYCFTIMEQNRLGPKQQQADSNMTLTQSSSSSASLSNGLTASLAKYMFHTSRNKDFVMLDAYFPFDPMYLPNAKAMIKDIYVEWVADEDDSESDDDDDDEEEDEYDMDDSDLEDD